MKRIFIPLFCITFLLITGQGCFRNNNKPVESETSDDFYEPALKAVLICNGHTYKHGDSISITEILADSVYPALQDNQDIASYNDLQIDRYQVKLPSGATYKCNGKNMRPVIKEAIEKHVSEGSITIQIYYIHMIDKDGKTADARGMNFTILPAQ